MSRVPCEKCNTEITEVTARINNGLCMLCKNNAQVCTKCGTRVLNCLPVSSGFYCTSCRGTMELTKEKVTTFDLNRLIDASISAITEFAKKHSQETFYAFALDANMLCLNSLECSEKSLAEYRDKWYQRTRQLSSFEEMTDDDHINDDFYLTSLVEYEIEDLNDKDACLKALNKNRSEERAKGCPYELDAEILDLKMNTGDWYYQGFFDLEEEDGFCDDLYDEHYDANMDSPTVTEYSKTMLELIKKIEKSGVLQKLNLTKDFTTFLAEHNY